ncbi:MAG TPA: hypothetical protein VH331_05850 [Allosphingosinicella sp.]|jgi:hypothetical protein|nr:hypothetical protein [Allosphingosinicella sp.]
MTAILRSKDWEVEQRLRELGLSIDEINAVAREAYRARMNCSPLHPPTYPGTAGWATAVFQLRDTCLPKGWRYADPGNFSMTINDKLNIYIVVATGDENCGRPYGKEPSTKTPKGMKTEAAVKRQPAFDFIEAVSDDEVQAGGVAGYMAFWLLLNFSERQIFVELSSPAEIERGKITDWHERNVLPIIDLDTPPISKDGKFDDGFTPDLDVPVRRIR